MSSRDIPLPKRRFLRQEVNFGCAICGSPLLEMHHIIPWHVVHEHNVEDMVALCPTCAYRADQGEFSDNYLRDLKQNPHNVAFVNDAFNIQTEDITFVLGGNEFINVSKILEIDNFRIISVSREEKFPVFDVNFFDICNNWIAVILDNEWVTDTNFIWDLEYKPKHLIIRCAPRNVTLEIQIKNDVIYVKGTLFFNRFRVDISDNDITLNGGKFYDAKMLDMKIIGDGVSDKEGLKITTGAPMFAAPT